VLVSNGSVPRGRGAYLYRTRPAAGIARNVPMPAEAEAYAQALYLTLHELDGEDWDWIAVERPPAEPEWAAILDRLTRACER